MYRGDRRQGRRRRPPESRSVFVSIQIDRLQLHILPLIASGLAARQFLGEEPAGAGQEGSGSWKQNHTVPFTTESGRGHAAVTRAGHG